MTEQLPPLAYELLLAARKGQLNDIRRLVRKPELEGWKPDALVAAACAGKVGVEVVRFLAPQCDATEALTELADIKGARPEVVSMLLPTSDPKFNESSALRSAAHNDNVEVVTMLLPLSDPKACDSEALQHAAVYGNKTLISMLLPLSDADAAWRGLKEKYFRCGSPERYHHEEFIKAAEHLCGGVSGKTLLNYAEEHPELCAQGPMVRARVAALRFDNKIPKGPTAVRQTRL